MWALQRKVWCGVDVTLARDIDPALIQAYCQ